MARTGTTIAGMVMAVGSMAQLQLGGIAPGRTATSNVLSDAPVVVLQPLDAPRLLAEDEQREAQGIAGPYRFADTYAVDIGLGDGAWDLLPAGDRIWRLTLECREARSMGLVFDRFVIPTEARVYLVNEAGEQRGGYGRPSGGRTMLAVDQFAGERITIEYHQPAAAEGPVDLHIATVYPAYRGVAGGDREFGESMPCNINVVCPEGDEWRDHIRSVARVNVGAGHCSGALLNNCLNDGTPYFLTANHCLVGDVSSWIFTFNWDSPTCDPTEDSPMTMSLSGADLLITQVSTDFTLVRLFDTPPESYNVYYSGWDASGIPAQEVVSVHHPAGDIKKISRSFDAVEAGQQVVGTELRDVWQIEYWDDGIVEQGSSGSPLWSENKLLVGQLSGGLGTCDDDTAVAAYGRFDLAYPLMAPWLGECATSLPGIDDDDVVIPIFEDAAVTSISNIAELLCDVDSVAPVITLKNNGINVLESAVIQYSINGGTIYEQPWTGELFTGQTTTVSLAAIPAVPGSNSLQITVTAPNGLLDQVLENDSWNLDYTTSFPAGTVNLILTLDDFGSDVTWQLESSDGTVLHTGGPYADGNDGQVDSVAFCLTNDCYIFTINDFFGDGICCAEGDGNYVLRDTYGTIYGESDGQYGDQDVSPFCLEAVSIEEVEHPVFRIHPNPNDGGFQVTGAMGGTIRNIRVLDALGRTVQVIQGNGNTTALVRLDLRPGAYTVVIDGPQGTATERMIVAR